MVRNRRLLTCLAAIALGIAALAGGCRKKPAAGTNLDVQNQVALRGVRLYYESPALILVAEPRNVQVPQNPAGAITVVMRELLKGPVNPALPRLLPADTVLRGAFLLPDGTAFVDLGGPTLTQGWATGSHQELMAVYSIVQTLTANFNDAKRVRILVNGAPAETLGGHVALDRSLRANPGLVDPRFR